MNAKHFRHALILTAVLTSACDNGAVEESEIQRLGDGFVLLSESDEAHLTLRDASVFVELPDAGTQAWEPGNGYFSRNDDDPETQVWYDSCDTSSASPSSSELVDRVLVDAESQTLLWSSLVTFVPQIDGVTVINAATGEPLAVGDELDPRDCDYTSSYAHCETENVAFDFSAVPFPGPPSTLASSTRSMRRCTGTTAKTAFASSDTDRRRAKDRAARRIRSSSTSSPTSERPSRANLGA